MKVFLHQPNMFWVAFPSPFLVISGFWTLFNLGDKGDCIQQLEIRGAV